MFLPFLTRKKCPPYLFLLFLLFSFLILSLAISGAEGRANDGDGPETEEVRCPPARGLTIVPQPRRRA